jgi:chromosome segregation ATPase
MILVCLFLVFYGLWIIILSGAARTAAEENYKMAVNLAGVQGEIDTLATKLGVLETAVSGIAEDYTTLQSRIEALEAALVANDPVAVQAALDEVKTQLAGIGVRLGTAIASLATLDASVPPPPQPEV